MEGGVLLIIIIIIRGSFKISQPFSRTVPKGKFAEGRVPHCEDRIAGGRSAFSVLTRTFLYSILNFSAGHIKSSPMCRGILGDAMISFSCICSLEIMLLLNSPSSAGVISERNAQDKSVRVSLRGSMPHAESKMAA